MSLPIIENIYHFPLSDAERDVLQHMFANYERLVIKAEFGGGFGGCRVFMLRPVAKDGAQLPAVVKLGPLPLIQEEWQAFHRFAQRRVPKIARIESEPIVSDNGRYGGIQYQLAGDGHFQTDSLRNFCLQASASANDVTYVLNNLVFPSIGTLWQNSQVAFEFYVARSFDPILPLNYRVEWALDLQSARRLMPHTIRQDYNIHDPVAISGFVITEVDQAKAELTLDLPGQGNGTASGFRLRVTAVPDIDQYQKDQLLPEPMMGIVQETRQSYLQTQISQLFNEQYFADTNMIAIAGIAQPLPNPVTDIPLFLHQTRDLKISSIHGDLNLENILVEYDDAPRNVHLIDFARARQDYVLHDLLRLETGFWLYLVPEEMAENGRDLSVLPAFIQSLTGEGTLVAGLEKSQAALTAVRQAARPFLLNGQKWQEYYQGLVLYLLGAMKFKNLDDEPTAPLPRLTAVTAATIINQQLKGNPVLIIAQANEAADGANNKNKTQTGNQGVEKQFMDKSTEDRITKSMPPNIRILMLDILSTRFGEEELKELCFSMDLDYENLAGSNKRGKARELVLYAERHNLMSNLIFAGHQMRKDIEWPGYGGGGARLPQKPALMLTAQAGLLNIMLRQSGNDWQLEVHNIGIFYLTQVSLILRPSPTVRVSKSHIMFGTLQPGETMQANTPVQIQVQVNELAKEPTTQLAYEVNYQTPNKTERQFGYLIIPAP